MTTLERFDRRDNVPAFNKHVRTVFRPHNFTVCGGTKIIQRTSMYKEAVLNATGVFVVSRPSTAARTRHGGERPREILGFLVYTVKPKSSELYIDLVCGAGHGKRLIQESIDLAKAEGLSYVTLSAVAYIVNYYRKLGFINSRTCHEDPAVTKKAATVADKKFRNYGEAVKDKAFTSFLNLLSHHHLTKDPNCKTVPQCDDLGYDMVYCIGGPRTPKQKTPVKPNTPALKRKPSAKSKRESPAVGLRRSERIAALLRKLNKILL